MVGSSSKPPTELQSGSVSVQGSELVQAVSANSGTVVYGLFGNIGKAKYKNLTPSEEESEVFYCARGASNIWQLKAMSVSDGSVRFIRDLNGAPGEMRISPDGASAYISIGLNGGYRLYRYPLDGSPRSLIDSDCLSFAFTADGSQIVYVNYNTPNGTWLMNPNATGKKKISGAYYPRVLGCPDQNLVRIADHSVWTDIVDLELTGGGVGNSTPNTTLLVGTTPQAGGPMWGVIDQGGTTYLVRTINRALTSPNCSIFTPASYLTDVGGIGASPTGRRAVVTVPNLGTGRIVDGTSNTVLFEEQRLGNPVAWGPYVLSRDLIGTTDFAAGAGGLLFSENGERMPAVVVIDAVTRTSCHATQVSADGATNTVFRVDCDNLSKLSYAQNAAYTFNDVVSGPSGMKGAFVSFSAETGRLASVTLFDAVQNVAQTPQGVEVTGSLQEVFASGRKAFGETGRVRL